VERLGGNRGFICRVSVDERASLLPSSFRRQGRRKRKTRRFADFVLSFAFLLAELQGHAIKNADLLIASGAVTLPSSSTEAQEALQEDLQAVSFALRFFTPTFRLLFLLLTSPPSLPSLPLLSPNINSNPNFRPPTPSTPKSTNAPKNSPPSLNPSPNLPTSSATWETWSSSKEHSWTRWSTT